MSAAPRRPGISRHPVRAAAEAAREAEEQESGQHSPAASTATVVTEAPAPVASDKDHKPQATRNGGNAAASADGDASESRQRLGNGRVSYAGRAVTIYFPSAEDKDRAQAAFAARGGIEGFTSLSGWMADAILERTEAWETAHNNGKPFTEVLARREARRKRT